MSWVKLDDALFSHPKVLRAGNEATGAWIRMLAYCAAYLTDGVIDADTALSLAGRQKVIDRLVTARLLDRDGLALFVGHRLTGDRGLRRSRRSGRGAEAGGHRQGAADEFAAADAFLRILLRGIFRHMLPPFVPRS